MADQYQPAPGLESEPRAATVASYPDCYIDGFAHALPQRPDATGELFTRHALRVPVGRPDQQGGLHRQHGAHAFSPMMPSVDCARVRTSVPPAVNNTGSPQSK